MTHLINTTLYVEELHFGTFAAFKYGRQIPNTERETKEEVEELFEQILQEERRKLL